MTWHLWDHNHDMTFMGSVTFLVFVHAGAGVDGASKEIEEGVWARKYQCKSHKAALHNCRRQSCS